MSSRGSWLPASGRCLGKAPTWTGLGARVTAADGQAREQEQRQGSSGRRPATDVEERPRQSSRAAMVGGGGEDEHCGCACGARRCPLRRRFRGRQWVLTVNLVCTRGPWQSRAHEKMAELVQSSCLRKCVIQMKPLKCNYLCSNLGGS